MFSNLDKFNDEQLEHIYSYAKEQIQMFGYNEFFVQSSKLI